MRRALAVRFRRRWLVVALVVALLGALAVPGAMFGYSAAQRMQRDAVTHFSSAQAHLERARTLVAQASGTSAQTSLDQARTEFEAARADFRSAAAVVDQTPARLVPSGPLLDAVASRVAAVDHLSAMGLALCDAGLRSIDIDAEFVKPAAPGQPTGTAHLLSLMGKVQDTLPALARDLDRARQEIAAIDPGVVPASQRASFQKARADIASGIAGVAELGRLVPAIRDVLAADGRHTYVVEQVNPFELRAGGGYIGTYSLLSADHGNLTVVRSGDTHDLPDYSTFAGQAGYVTPPTPMLGLLQSKSWSFQDSNFFPDFRDSARAAAGFAQRDFGTGVDGVISIDLYAVAALLGVTGPISVPGYPATLTKDNAIPTIMALDLVADPSRKRVISSVAGPLMQRLVALDSSQWLGLIQVLNLLATQRHLQVFFTSDRVQPEMERLGLAGDLAFSGRDDFIYLGEANFGGNKANYFLTRRLTLALSRTGADGALHHVLTEDLALDLTKAPAGYIVPYTVYGRLMLPAGARNLGLSGLAPDDRYSMTPPAAMTLLAGSAEMRTSGRRAQLRVTYQWDTPWTQDAAGAHTIYWQKQPGVAQDPITVTWTDGGSNAKAESDLGTDRLLTLAGSRVTIAQGTAARVSLPRL